MKKREVDVLLVTTPVNIYVSSKSGHVPQGLVASSSDEEPTFITGRMDELAAIQQMFIDRSHVIGYTEALIANPDRDGYDVIIGFILDEGFARKRIWLEAKFLALYGESWSRLSEQNLRLDKWNFCRG